MSELLAKVRSFMNSTAGMVISIGILLILVIVIWGYIFLSSSSKSQPPKIPEVASSGPTTPTAPETGPQKEVKPPTGSANPATKEPPQMKDLEFFQLKDPFRPLVSEQVSSEQPATSTPAPSASTVKTGQPIVP